jgi:sugar phosphate permease
MRGTLADGPSMESGPAGAPALYEVPSAYRYYIFCILTLSYTLNSLDRQVINILAEPIKHEFALKDWQLGVLTGLAFAALYSVLAVPIARIADRGNRPLVLSAGRTVARRRLHAP